MTWIDIYSLLPLAVAPRAELNRVVTSLSLTLFQRSSGVPWNDLLVLGFSDE